MSANDGGPAFPHWDGPSGECFNGMTLRDYFAAQVLPRLITWEDGVLRPYGDAAIMAYGFADRMLKERTR